MIRFCVAVTSLVLALAASAETYTEGQHYEAISPPVKTTAAQGKVEVVELFWYGCPHCFAFEPTIEKWLETKPDSIEFRRVPAIFARNWAVHARAYYAAEQLGVLDRTHSRLFEALHVKQQKIFTEDQIVAFFVANGVDEQAFRDAYNSFDVDSKTRTAMTLTRQYGITGVPAMIVNGRYRSSARQTGTYENLLKLVEYLAAKENSQ
ncbi:MAG: thiol:disulfide interchange protein DsbA/DsbL [Gammaproteobacteria bacterium]